MKKIIPLTVTVVAILMTGCATTQTVQVVPDRTKTIVGSSCRNFLLQPAPTMEKALEDLKKAAQGRKHSEPVCTSSQAAGIGTSCGMYWSQIVCEAELQD
jgi:PBP1b-binding outer membrane lipoprotein LpoB